MDVNKFLQGERVEWTEFIRPTTVNLILGKKGSGKSALGYYLLETIGNHFGLVPVVVNLPRDKQYLLPDYFQINTLEEVKNTQNSIVLIDEGSTMLPAGQAKLEEMVKGFQALSRQRNQIIILIFHASSDVGSRILRGVDSILLKEPSRRQIQHGSKDSWWHDLLQEAKGQFETIQNTGEDKRKFTYVDCEEPEFRGLLPNSLCSFWSNELSCAWAGVESYSVSDAPLKSTGKKQSNAVPLTYERLPEEPGIIPRTDEKGYLYGFKINDPLQMWIRSRKKIVELLYNEYPKLKEFGLDLFDCKIVYGMYSADVELPKRVPWTPQLKLFELRGE